MFPRYKKKKKYQDAKKPFKWKRMEGEIILWAVRWYSRYALSYRDLKETFQERGLSIARASLCRWVHEYGPELAKRVTPYLKKTHGSWRVDETYGKVKGVWKYLYRAIDKQGQTLDWMLSATRNQKAAKRFFKKVLKKAYVTTPQVINVDKNPAFVPAVVALKEEGVLPASTKLRQVKYLNNGIENDPKAVKSKSRYRQWYQSMRTAKATIEGIETLRLIQKGQVKYLAPGEVRAQNQFIHHIFGLAA